MSCTCNKSKICDPCAFCSPPGVTCLTTCEPIDPCESKLDLSCVVYSGNVTSFCNIDPRGKTLYELLLTIFTQSFGNPFTACCLLQGSIELITTTTTTSTSTTTTSTTTSTTSTTSTTTTTTRALLCYSLSSASNLTVSYLNQNNQWIITSVSAGVTKYVCAYVVTAQAGLTITSVGNCGVEQCQPTTTTTSTTTTSTTTSTTTTTTTPQIDNCYCYSLYNNSNTATPAGISYTDNKGCLGKPGAPMPVYLLPSQITYVCATARDLSGLPSSIIRTIVNTVDCSISSGCQTSRTVCTTLTATGGSVGYTYYNGDNIKITATLVSGASINVCAWGVEKVSGTGTLTILPSSTFCTYNEGCNVICNCFSVVNRSSVATFNITYISCNVDQTTVTFSLLPRASANFCANGPASNVTYTQTTITKIPEPLPLTTLLGPCNSTSACAF